jgi:hypothetical protein
MTFAVKCKCGWSKALAGWQAVGQLGRPMVCRETCVIGSTGLRRVYVRF